MGTQRVPRLDPALSRCGFCNVIARRQPLAGRPYKPNNHTTMQKPSFEERAQEMHEAAFRLKEIAEVILLEAQRMQSASERFNARKDAKTTSR